MRFENLDPGIGFQIPLQDSNFLIMHLCLSGLPV